MSEINHSNQETQLQDKSLENFSKHKHSQSVKILTKVPNIPSSKAPESPLYKETSIFNKDEQSIISNIKSDSRNFKLPIINSARGTQINESLSKVNPHNVSSLKSSPPLHPSQLKTSKPIPSLQDLSSLSKSHFRSNSLLKPSTQTDVKKCKYRIQEDYGHLYRNIFLPESKKIITDLQGVRDKFVNRKASEQTIQSIPGLSTQQNSVSHSQMDEKILAQPSAKIAAKIKMLRKNFETSGISNQNEGGLTGVQLLEGLGGFNTERTMDKDNTFVTGTVQGQEGIFGESAILDKKEAQDFLGVANTATVNQSTILQQQASCDHCPHCKLKGPEKHKYKKIYQDLSQEETFFYDNLDFQSLLQNNESIKKIYQNMEPMSRKEANVFNNLLHEIIQRNIKIEDFVDKKTLQDLMNLNLYRGISIDNTASDLVGDILEDEMDLEDISVINQIYKDRHFFKYCSSAYKTRINQIIKNKADLDKPTEMRRNGSVASLASPERQRGIQREGSILTEFFNQKKRQHSKSTRQYLAPQEQKNLTSLILYLGFQEITRQISVNFKDRGVMLMVLFKKYFEENEKKWIEILKSIKIGVDKLKQDREFLINKYFEIDESNPSLTGRDPNEEKYQDNKEPIKSELQKVLDCSELTFDNLGKHKLMINQLMGHINTLEDKLFIQTLEKKNFEKEVYSFVEEWDKIRISQNLKERLAQGVTLQRIYDSHNADDQIKHMRKDELALMCVGEKFLQSVPYKNVWQLDQQVAEAKLKKIMLEFQQLSEENKRINDDKITYSKDIREKAQKIHNLEAQIKKYQSNLLLRDHENKEVMTVIDFRNVDFTTQADMIFDEKMKKKGKKITKLMNKITHGLSKEKPMPKKDLIDIIHMVYTEKSEALFKKNDAEPGAVQNPSNAGDNSFEDYVYNFISKRYGLKKKIKKKSEEFLLALKDHSVTDEHIEYFKKFMGVDEKGQFPTEVFEFYMKAFKSKYYLFIIATEESFVSVLTAPTQSLEIDIRKAFFKSCEVFANAPKALKQEQLRNFIYESRITIDGKAPSEITMNERFEIYALYEFYSNLMDGSNKPFQDTLKSKFIKEEEKLIQLMSQTHVQLKFNDQYTANDGDSPQFIKEESKIDKKRLQELKGHVLLEDFIRIFMNTLSENAKSVCFSLLDKVEFVKKYFSKAIRLDDKSGQWLICHSNTYKVFRHSYKLKVSIPISVTSQICMRLYLSLSNTFALRFIQESERFYKKVFSVFDQNRDGFLDPEEFESLVKKLDPKRPQWKILALFEQVLLLQNFRASVINPDIKLISADQLVKSSLSNVLMEGLMDQAYVLDKEDKNDEIAKIDVSDLKSPRRQETNSFTKSPTLKRGATRKLSNIKTTRKSDQSPSISFAISPAPMKKN